LVDLFDTHNNDIVIHRLHPHPGGWELHRWRPHPYQTPHPCMSMSTVTRVERSTIALPV